MSNKTNQSVLVNDTSSYYLKQYAALQFPGSVDNFGTKTPIHLLQEIAMKSFNVVVTVSTTICVDANTPEDAIKKVQKALDANDAGTAMQLGENLSCALRDGGYQVTNAVEVDE